MPVSPTDEPLVIRCNKNVWTEKPIQEHRVINIITTKRPKDCGKKSAWAAVGSFNDFPLPIDTDLHALALLLLCASGKGAPVEAYIEGVSISRNAISQHVTNDPNKHISQPCDQTHRHLEFSAEESQNAAKLLIHGQHFDVWERTLDQLRQLLQMLCDKKLLRPEYLPAAMEILNAEKLF